MKFLNNLNIIQKYYLLLLSFSTIIVLWFSDWFGYIIGGIVINVFIWSVFTIMVYNYAKERNKLILENKQLKQSLLKENHSQETKSVCVNHVTSDSSPDNFQDDLPVTNCPLKGDEK